MKAARDVLDAATSESEFQKAVIELAHANGWLAHAERPAMNKAGNWRTPIQGDKGFPDLVLTRYGDLVIAELKTQKGTLPPAQRDWLAVLQTVPGIQVYVWRPKDWPVIEDVLRRRRFSRAPISEEG